jgi:hypothetical protein
MGFRAHPTASYKYLEIDGLRRRLLDRHRHDTIEQGHLDVDAAHLDVDAAQTAPIHGPVDLGSLLNGQRQDFVDGRLKRDSLFLGHLPQNLARMVCAAPSFGQPPSLA